MPHLKFKGAEISSALSKRIMFFLGSITNHMGCVLIFHWLGAGGMHHMC